MVGRVSSVPELLTAGVAGEVLYDPDWLPYEPDDVPESEYRPPPEEQLLIRKKAIMMITMIMIGLIFLPLDPEEAEPIWIFPL